MRSTDSDQKRNHAISIGVFAIPHIRFIQMVAHPLQL